MKLAFIGAGVMGEAIIAGVLDKGIVSPADISACDISAARREHLAKTYGVSVGEEAAAVSSNSDVVMTAVNRRELCAAGRARNSNLNGRPSVMSIMADGPIEAIRL